MKTISTDGGGGTPYNGLYGGGDSAQEGYVPFQALVGEYMKGQGFH